MDFEEGTITNIAVTGLRLIGVLRGSGTIRDVSIEYIRSIIFNSYQHLRWQKGGDIGDSNLYKNSLRLSGSESRGVDGD